jgi:hypothetical protein
MSCVIVNRIDPYYISDVNAVSNSKSKRGRVVIRNGRTVALGADSFDRICCEVKYSTLTVCNVIFMNGQNDSLFINRAIVNWVETIQLRHKWKSGAYIIDQDTRPRNLVLPEL